MNSVESGRIGYLYVVVAAVLWASSGTTAKFLFANGVTPHQLVQLRLTIAAAGLFLFFSFRDRSIFNIARHDIIYFVVLGTIGMAAVNFTYMFAISKIHVAAAILLQYTAPVFITIYLVSVVREFPGATTLAAMLAALVGCFFVVGAYNPEVLSVNMAGVISGLASAVTFAWWSLHGAYGMRRYRPWTVLFYAVVVGALEWNLIHPPLEAFRHDYPLPVWLGIIHVGILGTLLPFGLYLVGIRHVGPTRAAITSTLEPITAGIIAWALLGEEMAPLQIAGGGLVIAAVVLLQIVPVTVAEK